MSRWLYTKGIDAVGVGTQFWIFAIGADHQMVYKYWDGANWQPSQSGWLALGGNFISAPSAAARVAGAEPGGTVQLDVSAVGWTTDVGRLQITVLHRFWNGNSWEPEKGWESVGSLGDFPASRGAPQIETYPPVAITGITGPHDVDIVAVDRGGQVVHRSLVDGSWQPASGWESLGAGIMGAPAVAGLDNVEMPFNVFGVSPNGNILHQFWDGSAWNPSQTTWEDLGAPGGQPATSVVAAGMVSDVEFDVFGFNVGRGGPISNKSYGAGTNNTWLPLQQWNVISKGTGVGYLTAVEGDEPLNLKTAVPSCLRQRSSYDCST